MQEYLYFPPAFIMTQPLQKLNKYIRDELHVDDEKEQMYFDNCNPADLDNVIERQKKLIN